MKDSFSGFHPIVSFAFFTAVLLFSMFEMHPAFILISIFCGGLYSVYQGGRKSVRFGFMYLLPLTASILLINPAFNHQGVTILRYLPSGNPLTLESVIYGFASAGLLIGVIVWFSCFNRVVTSDKFMYLFGRIIPSLSLVLSMTIRFVPRFKEEFTRVRQAQKAVGRDISDGKFTRKIRNFVRIFSVMISLTLENSIETADSMKSRGYGLKGRTAYSNFRFERRDGVALTAIFVLSGYVLVGILKNAVEFFYYPSIFASGLTAYSLSVFCGYFLLCSMPMLINLKEDLKWKSLRSKI